jgi:integrase
MQDESSQDARTAGSRFARLKTRHRGVSYRELGDGTRKYYVTLTVKGKTTYVPAGTSEKEALAKQAELRHRTAKGEKIVTNVKTTFGELAETWLASKTRIGARTRRNYRDALDLVHLPRFGDWRVASVDADAIAKLIRDLEREGLHAIDPKRPVRPLSSWAISNDLKPLAQTLDLAVRRGLIPSNPYRTLVADERPRKTEPKPAFEWSDEQIEALLTAAKKLAQRKDARYDYEPLLRTATHCGLRAGELTGLCWRHIDLDKAVLTVEQQFTQIGTIEPPKTKAGIRRVPLTPEMVSFFRTLKLASKFSKEEDFVFSSANGTPLQHSNVGRRGFKPARNLAGLPEALRLHDLRHAFASRCAARGVPVNVLSEVMGHADIGITLRTYTHLYGRDQAEQSFRLAMSGGAQV